MTNSCVISTVTNVKPDCMDLGVCARVHLPHGCRGADFFSRYMGTGFCHNSNPPVSARKIVLRESKTAQSTAGGCVVLNRQRKDRPLTSSATDSQSLCVAVLSFQRSGTEQKSSTHYTEWRYTEGRCRRRNGCCNLTTLPLLFICLEIILIRGLEEIFEA